MTIKPISRQRAYQLRRIAEGKCKQCGLSPLETKGLCYTCAKKASEGVKRKRGLTPKFKSKYQD